MTSKTIERTGSKVVKEVEPDLSKIPDGKCTMEQALWMVAAHQVIASYRAKELQALSDTSGPKTAGT